MQVLKHMFIMQYYIYFTRSYSVPTWSLFEQILEPTFLRERHILSVVVIYQGVAGHLRSTANSHISFKSNVYGFTYLNK